MDDDLTAEELESMADEQAAAEEDRYQQECAE